MAKARRSSNSHAARLKELPHVARQHRVEPFRLADEAELLAVANRIARLAGWCSVAGWSPEEVDFRLYRFATAAEAEVMRKRCSEAAFLSGCRSVIVLILQ